MGAELPVVSAIIARLPEPEINLAAYGGIVFSLSLIIESPIIMLLAASTALSKDLDSYYTLRRYMTVAGAVLTGLHILIAFTPLYYVVVEGIIGAPQEIVAPARIGFMIMTPWTWSIAYRRFNQGALIRFGHSRAVTIGTIIRLSTNWLVLGLGYSTGSFPGIVVGPSAVAMGVICEAIYSGFAVRPVVKTDLASAKPVDEPLTLGAFLSFYIPLALTSLILLLALPIGSAALSRMPSPILSLAVWPVVTGLVFMLRSTGIAYNEVVVALLDEPRSYSNLRRFTGILSAAITGALLLFIATPLSTVWFERVSALSPELAAIADRGLLLTLPIPALSVLQSWFQGTILHGRHTRGITESVVIYLLSTVIFLGAGVAWGKTMGLFVGLAALTLSVLAQTVWLWQRSLPVQNEVKQRDAQEAMSAA